MAITPDIGHKDGFGSSVTIMEGEILHVDASGTVSGFEDINDLVFEWDFDDPDDSAYPINPGNPAITPNPNVGRQRIWAKRYENAGNYTVELTVRRMSGTSVAESTTQNLYVTVNDWSTATKYYVDQDSGSDSNDGSSHALAKKTLASAWAQRVSDNSTADAEIILDNNQSGNSVKTTGAVTGWTRIRPATGWTVRPTVAWTTGPGFSNGATQKLILENIQFGGGGGVIPISIGRYLSVYNCSFQDTARVANWGTDNQRSDVGFMCCTSVNIVDHVIQFEPNTNTEGGKRRSIISCNFIAEPISGTSTVRGDFNHSIIAYCNFEITLSNTIALFMHGPNWDGGSNAKTQNLICHGIVLQSYSSDACAQMTDGGGGFDVLFDDYLFDSCIFTRRTTNTSGKVFIQEGFPTRLTFRNCQWTTPTGATPWFYVHNPDITTPAAEKVTTDLRFHNCSFYSPESSTSVYVVADRTPGTTNAGTTPGLGAGFEFYNNLIWTPNCSINTWGVLNGGGAQILTGVENNLFYIPLIPTAAANGVIKANGTNYRLDITSLTQWPEATNYPSVPVSIRRAVTGTTSAVVEITAGILTITVVSIDGYNGTHVYTLSDYIDLDDMKTQIEDDDPTGQLSVDPHHGHGGLSPTLLEDIGSTNIHATSGHFPRAMLQWIPPVGTLSIDPAVSDATLPMGSFLTDAGKDVPIYLDAAENPRLRGTAIGVGPFEALPLAASSTGNRMFLLGGGHRNSGIPSELYMV